MIKKSSTLKASSSVTTKYQATIPTVIRNHLHIQAGDKIMFEIFKDSVQIRKMNPADYDYLKSLSNTLTEWNSPEDDEAYRNL